MSILELWQRSNVTNAPTSAATILVKPVELPAPSGGKDAARSGDVLPAFATEERAREVLHSSPYGPIRRVVCEVRQQILILRGRVPSFYMKQIAQTLLREVLSEGFALDNQVEVDRTERT